VNGLPPININYNRSAIAQYNLSIADINRIVNTALAGQSSGMLFEGEKRFDIVVKLKGEKKKDVTDIQNLLIPTPGGSQVPLYQLANVEIKEGPNQIQREDAKRRIVVGFNVRGRDVQSIVTELQEKTEAQLKLPPGYYITYGGAFENLNEAKKRLTIAVPVSLLLIFMLLYFAFNSIKQGLLIYSAIPLSAIGGILFLALRGMPFSISAGVGFIALFGVAVLNGIVLIAEFNRLKSEGLHDVKRIVLMGTKIRLRPVLMTAAVASLGFLPMALSNGAGAEVQRPLATVVIGGLLIATFLTLVVLPALYMVFEKGITMKKKNKISTVVLILLSCNMATAQTSITLQASIDTALKNNLQVKNEKLMSEYRKLMISSSAVVPQTNVVADIGQINSIYNDTKFGVSQSFSFPKVYSTQKQLLTEEWKSSTLQVAVREAELKKQVASVFYQLLYLQQKVQLLNYADSLYTAFYQLTELRLQKGESNILEKTTAETQLGQIHLQQKQLKSDNELQLLQFQLLLNTVAPFLPVAEKFKMEHQSIPVDITQHPAIQLLSHQQQIADAVVKAEKAKLLPDLSLGVFSSSIKGTGADNKYYGSGYRFQSIQVGIGIPVFAKAQKAKISGAKFSKQIAGNSYTIGSQTLQTELYAALVQYNKFNETVSYFEQTGLKNAALIIATANKQFSNGLINYLEWFMLINQAITVKNEYLDAVKNLNESIIRLNFYNNK